MRIVQAVFGVFHHFELARELERRGHLSVIYSTFPWRRLQREGLPHSRVQTFPWLHTAEFLFQKYRIGGRWATDFLGYRNALAFDEWMLRRIPVCDAFIAISGAGLKAGKKVQNSGGVYICDRGSSHQRYQEQIVTDEYQRWGVNIPVSDERDTVREEKIYEAADLITVPSGFAERSFLEMGIPKEKLRRIPYGVRLERFRPVGQPQEGRFDVLFAGAVSLRKGFPYLLQAFSQVQHPAKRLRVAGAMRPDLEAVLSRLPQQNVEFLGSVPQDRLIELMSTSTVMVLPSIEEGLALVQGQAMACGCPVIASTNTGSEDLFTDDVEGFIIPIRDTEVLTHRMQQLADDPSLRERMSQAALTRVKSLGGWKEYGDHWERLLYEVTGQNLREQRVQLAK
ncbi:glycosyltransferase family 4 protein [Edaphobacter sp. 12200R-103]|uniref:glycosyltransferase family 4 protein n=1 Tax=Edaphobacter sp. 12200R-103 TaxID=2703788 RepID=UPI00138B8037|nr:glycosyltransferase family 4 protein [Edaphobacter sp. 12200R-103]QHS51059.1 glycosyltransferase family 4 protein [Edaphobacter sp. 12200R-103]